MNGSDRELALNKRRETPRAVPFEISGLARWLSRWGLIVAEFGIVQIGVQALLAAAGLLIVRTLSKQEYALFVLANSMQTTCNLLADWGMNIGVRSIGGRVWNDRFRFGQLLNTALRLRWYFATLSLPLCLPLTVWMFWRNGADPVQIAGLCIAMTAGVIPLLGSLVWGVSPQLHGEYRRIQALDLGNAVLRLALISVLAIERLTALLAVMVGVVGNWIQAFFLRSWAREHADYKAPANQNDRRELFSIAIRWLPNVVFFCLQGQVTLLILAVIGNSTGIADVTALGRFSVIFTVFSTVFTNILAPRFARCQERASLQRLYLLLVGASILMLFPLFLLLSVFPELFLWVLGEKYEGLKNELGWVAAASCVSQLGIVMWCLNSSKAWIRVQSIAFIPVIITAQVLAAVVLDLREFHQVLIFNFVTATAPLPVYLIDALIGFKCLSQKSPELSPSPPESESIR
jgi:hypothetical protein